MRYYYRNKEKTAYVSFKTPDFDDNPKYIKITEEEFNAHLAELESEEEE